MDCGDGSGVCKAGNDDKKRITVTLTTIKGRDGTATMLPPWAVLHGKTGEKILKKLQIPGQMKVAFNENAYWNKEINLSYLQWLRGELDALKYQEVLCIFDSFTGQITNEAINWMKDHKLWIAIIPGVMCMQLWVMYLFFNLGGLTPVLQPLDILINRMFKVIFSQKYQQWLLSGNGPFLEDGSIKRVDNDTLLQFIDETNIALQEDPIMLVKVCQG